MKSEIEIRDVQKDGYAISNDQDKLQLDVIHGYLKRSYWAKDIDIELVKRSIQNSYCFGVYFDNKQVGFARLVTDYCRFAYLADVFILEEHRGKGLSKLLMEFMMKSPELESVSGWMLKTEDAHGLYSKFGFDKPKLPYRIMEYSK